MNRLDDKSAWVTCGLSEVALVIQGQSPPGDTYNTKENGLPFFQGKAEFGPIFPIPTKWCTQPSKIAEPGDVLISIRAPVGPTNQATSQCCIGRGLAAIRPYGTIPTRFLLYYLRHSSSMLAQQATGTTFKAISGRQLRQHPIVVPPLPEQHRIVGAIESYLTRLDDAVATLERVQRNLKRYRDSVLKAAIEGRLVPTEAELARTEGRDYEPASVLLDRILEERRRRWEASELARTSAKGRIPKDDTWKSKYKQPTAARAMELPSLPQGWAWVTVDAMQWDGGYGTSRKCQYDATGPPVLRIPNVQQESLNFDDLKFATGEGALSSDAVLLPGDFIFIRTNGSRNLIGRGALVARALPREYLFASYLIRLRLATGLTTAEWFALIWHTPILREQLLRDAASSAGQHNISLTSARRYVIPLPPLAEQERILAEVGRLLSVSESVQSVALTSTSRAMKLRRSVLGWAFAGRLVDQVPTDEPATRLLERIIAEREALDGSRSQGPGRLHVRSLRR